MVPKDVKKYVVGKFKSDFLKAHNEYRKMHGVDPLRYHKRLCRLGQEWATYLAKNYRLKHRFVCNYGENIYSISQFPDGFTMNGRTPVDAWYAENTKYNFGQETTDDNNGHFTQIVWRRSEFLGVGIAKSNMNEIIVVAYYHPAGNIKGNYFKNVFPQDPKAVKEVEKSRARELELLKAQTILCQNCPPKKEKKRRKPSVKERLLSLKVELAKLDEKRVRSQMQVRRSNSNLPENSGNLNQNNQNNTRRRKKIYLYDKATVTESPTVNEIVKTSRVTHISEISSPNAPSQSFDELASERTLRTANYDEDYNSSTNQDYPLPPILPYQPNQSLPPALPNPPILPNPPNLPNLAVESWFRFYKAYNSPPQFKIFTSPIANLLLH